MRKKFTMLLAALLACVGVVKAEAVAVDPTALTLPEMSTEGNIKWYTIKNVRTEKYATYAGASATMTQQATADGGSFFYFKGSVTDGVATVKIYNFKAENLLCAAYNSWTAEGIDWKIKAQTTGVSISASDSEDKAWNDAAGAGQKIEYWSASDPGSAWKVELVTDFSSLINISELKTRVVTELKLLASVSDIYPSAEEAVGKVNAVTPASNGLDDLNTAVEAINSVLTEYKENAYQALSGKYFTIHTPARSGVYMQMSGPSVVGTANAASPANLWQFVYNNGAVNVYNPYIDKYLCEPGGNSENIAVTSDKASAGAYQLVVSDIDTGSEQDKGDGAIVKLTSNGKSVHMAGGLTLVRWDNGQASEWNVAEVTNISSVISSYKESSKTTLDSWSTLSVVFDAALIATAKEAINNIATTDFATFAAIDAKLKNVTDKVAEKYFTFKNTDTANSNRVDAYLAANGSTSKGCGTKIFDYNAIWRLKSAGGTSFYLYNELNGVYLKNPSSGDLVADPVQAATYTFEIIDAETNKAELKSGNETLHLAGGLGLLNYDYDDPASRWIIATYDYKADLTALIADNKTNHAEEPALGQYTTTAYNALVEAGNTATTVVEVAEAIAAFKAAKNLPVFTINGVISYATGKSLYDDEDGRPNFKATNVFDKTMWWVFDQATETIGVTESVDVINYATRKGFWDAEALKITETSDANEADGIFLFYTVGNGTPLHFQDNNQVIVRYNETASTSGSATKFTHIGNTYDLDKLTDEVFISGNELAAVNVPSFNIAEGVNSYTEELSGALAAAVANRTAVLNDITSTAEEIAAAKAQLETALEGVSLNMPVQGRFYRIRCAGDGMKRIQSTTGLRQENDIRLEMKSGDEGINAGSVFCYIDGALVSYTTGLYINAYRFNEVGTKSDVVFSEASNGKVGAYNITIDGRYIFGASENNMIDSGESPDNRDGYNWWLEEVTTLPVTVTAAGYATLYAPVALTVAENVNVYTAEVAGDYVTLSDVATTIPANTGVIIKATAGTYNFTITDDVDAIETNDLQGSYAKSVKNADVNVYTLQAPDEKPVGFYLFNGTDGTNTTYINGFRAWIELPASSNVKALSIGRGEGTTSIDELSTVNGQQTTVIYDLTGRRVEKMEKGIYIVNGRKVIVK